MTAITSSLAKLRQYSKLPKNGLALFCGLVESNDGKSKKLNLAFEPVKPVTRSMYLCDRRFHTEVGLLLSTILPYFI